MLSLFHTASYARSGDKGTGKDAGPHSKTGKHFDRSHQFRSDGKGKGGAPLAPLPKRRTGPGSRYGEAMNDRKRRDDWRGVVQLLGEMRCAGVAEVAGVHGSTVLAVDYMHIHYSAVVVALAREGRLGEAFEYFERMQAGGIAPDMIAYNALITACANRRRCDRAFEIFESMKRSRENLRPNVITYNYDIVAEDALRGKKFEQCIRYCESKLNQLGGEWDRVAVYHMLRACLEMGAATSSGSSSSSARAGDSTTSASGIKLGKQKLASLRERFPGQMMFHEYFFVLYLENELTECSEDDNDRVLLRVNKFADVHPRQVALCNIKQSRDFYEKWGAVKNKQGSGGPADPENLDPLLQRSLALAERGSVISEGRVWLAFLGARVSGKAPSGFEAMLRPFEDRVTLLSLLIAPEGAPALSTRDDHVGALMNEKFSDEDDEGDDVARLAERFCELSQSSDTFAKSLKKLLALEKALARPVVDLEGNEVLEKDEFVWEFPGIMRNAVDVLADATRSEEIGDGSLGTKTMMGVGLEDSAAASAADSKEPAEFEHTPIPWAMLTERCLRNHRAAMLTPIAEATSEGVFVP